MLQKLLNLADTIKLSVSKYLLLTAAGVVGVLALILRFRTGQLKEAQAKLLKAQQDLSIQPLQIEADKAAITVKEAEEKFNKAMEELDK